ncbi:MAG: SRPBCC family protein [Pseudomonadota bacterium]
MMNDIETYLGAVERSVVSLEKEGAPARAVVLSRSYNTSAEDLWEAVTSSERLPRWFAPVEGDLRPGGHYKVQGNAGGKIIECDPPHRLFLTWEINDEVSWVEVTLTAQGDGKARLTLTHTAKVTPFWTQYGPGATGVGWDLALFGLMLHVRDPQAEKIDEEFFGTSDAGKAMIGASSTDWGEAAIRGGESPEQARAAAARTTAFYTGAPEPD